MSPDKQFTGQRLDSTGLYYYGARYYDPTIGRFISPDTIIPNPANPQAFNRYSYCLNNPLKYIDPSGHGYRENSAYLALDYLMKNNPDEPVPDWITNTLFPQPQKEVNMLTLVIAVKSNVPDEWLIRGNETYLLSADFLAEVGKTKGGDFGVVIVSFADEAYEMNAIIDLVDWEVMQMFGVTVDDIVEIMLLLAEMETQRKGPHAMDDAYVSISLDENRVTEILTSRYGHYSSEPFEMWKGGPEYALFSCSSGHTAIYWGLPGVFLTKDQAAEMWKLIIDMIM